MLEISINHSMLWAGTLRSIRREMKVVTGLKLKLLTKSMNYTPYGTPFAPNSVMTLPFPFPIPTGSHLEIVPQDWPPPIQRAHSMTSATPTPPGIRRASRLLRKLSTRTSKRVTSLQIATSLMANSLLKDKLLRLVSDSLTCSLVSGKRSHTLKKKLASE